MCVTFLLSLSHCVCVKVCVFCASLIALRFYDFIIVNYTPCCLPKLGLFHMRLPVRSGIAAQAKA